MLTITIPAVEKWDETNNLFVYDEEWTLQLEHSLLSISKWESKWCKPFLSQKTLSFEESIDYIRCMTLTENVPLNIYENITDANVNDVAEYIKSPMTATWFRKDNAPQRNGKEITSELIYYWMTVLNIPFECEKWHLNRLLTLIRICNVENSPKKKMKSKDIYAQNRALNAARRRQLHSKG